MTERKGNKMLPRELKESLENNIPIHEELYFKDYPVPQAVLDYVDNQIKTIKKTKAPKIS